MSNKGKNLSSGVLQRQHAKITKENSKQRQEEKWELKRKKKTHGVT